MDLVSDDLQICHQCVGDPVLSAEIARSEVAECSYCESVQACWSLQELADRIELAFEQHYIRTNAEPNDWQSSLIRDRESSYDWEREGMQVLYAIQDAADISEAAAKDVLAILSDRHCDQDSAQLGAETEFDPDSHYERKASSDELWQFHWEKFERTLLTESRFFGRAAAAHLQAVFGGIDQLSTWEGSPLVVDAGPDTPINMLYRARVFQSEEALKTALCRPDRELGSPPGRFASAGRMNAHGISVFYGATAQAVALAEVRPPVGSDVALAAFRIIRPLRLLDLRALAKTHIRGSVFDPTLLRQLERVAFLRTLGNKMTRPVMPDDQQLDYLATQAVADFLATENTPLLDGIIFESTQSDEGQNIVLFHKTSQVREMDLPEDMQISARTVGYDTDSGVYPDYEVREEVQSETSGDATPAHRRPEFSSMFLDLWDDDTPREALEVIPESVEVHHVNKVRVECTPYKVVRRRKQRRKDERL